MQVSLAMKAHAETLGISLPVICFEPGRSIVADAGLTVYTTDDETKMSWRNDNIDWTKSKAYCFGSCFVNVNLKDREPCGIVSPEDYDGVVRDIIKALEEGVQTPDGKTRGIAFAVPRDQAGFVGQGGLGSGDVVFGILGGEIGGYFGGVHSVQIPSAKGKGGGDMRPVCIMAGKGLKKGHILERPTDITDIIPTLFYLLGYPQTKDATGGVVFAAYEDK
jgi:predicted AlkP superfamily phosphohydrolase/phosphomutase